MTRAARPRYRGHTQRLTPAPTTPETSEAQGIPTPITELPHLAEAARRLGQTGRVIRVDAPKPQEVRTPGRSVGQWLMSGERLKTPTPQPFTPAEIAEIERGDMDIWEGGFDR
ncbi:hypothetical protein [Nocardia asteroides]|uniref:hypothetical protein n=1 Tax=Nocardia asteroides TaxID=1824 RepID=UPI0033DD6F83